MELHIQISSKGGGKFPFNYEFALLTKKSKALTSQAGSRSTSMRLRLIGASEFVALSQYKSLLVFIIVKGPRPDNNFEAQQ